MLVRRFVLLASSLLLIVAVPAAGDQVDGAFGLVIWLLTP
jgi:hypothetical protein